MSNEINNSMLARGGETGAISGGVVRRDAARKAFRAKIQSLLRKSEDGPLACVWQLVYPCAIDPLRELPDRRGIIEDLADFAEVLRPNLNGMHADRLCRLIARYASCGSSRSDLPA
jgi:hypothetical protein